MALTGQQTQAVEEEPSADEWEYKLLSDLTGGVNLSDRSDAIRDSELLEAENIRFESGKIVSTYGYNTFGQLTRGDARATYQFFL